MSTDLVDKIAAELDYDARRVREMRLLKMLYDGGWRSGTDARIAWVRGLSDSQLNGMSSSIVLGRAEDTINNTVRTIYEKTGYSEIGGHGLDGQETPPGTVRKLMDGPKPAFSDVFNERFWSTPLAAADLTIKDVNLILPVELRAANFGVPTNKPET